MLIFFLIQAHTLSVEPNLQGFPSVGYESLNDNKVYIVYTFG